MTLAPAVIEGLQEHVIAQADGTAARIWYLYRRKVPGRKMLVGAAVEVEQLDVGSRPTRSALI